MGAIFSYSLVSGVILILLYIAYKFTMAGERQFAFNRIMIFSIYALALALPVAYSALSSMDWRSHQSTAFTIDIDQDFGVFPVIPVIKQTPVWIQVLLWIYLGGVVVASIRLFASLATIMLLARQKENLRLDNGYILVLTDDRQFSPFSFLRYIVISREDYAKSKDTILIHEITHLRKHHWIDQIAGNLIAIFMWYNPAAWLMIEELKTVHEFQADEAVIASGTDMRNYQYLLIEKAVGKRFPSPANSLNHSKLKKRVTMMYKSKPSPVRRLAGIAVIPAAIVALAIVNIPAFADVISETESASLRNVSDSKITNFSEDTQVPGEASDSENTIKVIAVGTKKKNGEPVGEISLVENLDEVKVVGPRHPENVGKPSAQSSGDEDRSSVYRDDVEILINGVKSPESVVEKLDPNEIELIEVTQNEETSGKKRVSITLKSPDAQSSASSSSSSSDVYVSVEQIPEYPGGMNELMKYLTMNIRYPEEAMKNDIQGRVIVKFVVAKDGSIRDANVVKAVDPLLDKEALRVVNSMPNWNPGKVKGEAVDCYFNLPVNFKLQENTEPSKSDSSTAN